MVKHSFKKISILLIITIFLVGCQAKVETHKYEKSAFVLGTIINITLIDHGSDELLDKMVDRLKEIEETMSINIDDSEASRINLNAGIKSVKVSEDTYYVIKKALEFSELSEGSFDITFGPIVDLWQIGTENAHVPEAEEIKRSLSYVDYHKVILNDYNEVFLQEKGMEIDLGGIAKGYAADEIIRIAEEHGVESAIVNLGGNIRVLGSKKDNQPYRIGIQNPFDERNEYFGILSVKDQTVVTSGNYERYFVENEIRYHHIFDKETGYPVRNNLASVSVITEMSIDADALSTALYVLGVEKGMELVESLNGVEVIYVTKDKEIHLSSGIGDSLELTDESFIIK